MESGNVYSVIGKISKTVKNGDSLQIFLEKAVVTGPNGELVHTGVVCYALDEGYIKGDTISFACELKKVPSPDNPGEFDLSRYYAAHNIFYQAYPKEIDLRKPCSNPWILGIFRLKEKLRQTYLAIGDEKEAGVCISMVLGDKSELSDDLKKIFRDNGIAHILAISGLHISLIGMSIYGILRKTGINFGISAGVSSFVMLSYGIMTGNSVSTIRAIVMFIMTIYAQVFGRTYDSISAMCLSAIIILIRYPGSIYNSGLYLSFAAVSAIVLMNPVIIRLFEIKNILVKAFMLSLSVTISTLPILAFSYYEIPLYAIFLNMLVVPCMGMLMTSALLAGIGGILNKYLGIFCLGPASFIIKFYEKICNLVQLLPGNKQIVGAPAVWQMLIFELVLWGTVWLFTRKILKSKGLFTALCTFAVLFLLWRPEAEFEMVMLSVGQGDCMYLSGNGCHILIDGGSFTEKNIGANTILPFLKYKGVRSLDYVILTHPDKDHYSGILEIMEDGSIPIDCFVMPGIDSKDENYLKLWEIGQKFARQLKEIYGGEYLIKDNLVIRCIHPRRGYSAVSVNDYSASFWIQYGNLDIITTGDLEQSGETDVLNYFPLHTIEILKCGHHGSSSSSGEQWVNALKPTIALISCGRNNRYGHPHNETIERLEAAGSRILRTDELGAIMFSITPSGKLEGKWYR